MDAEYKELPSESSYNVDNFLQDALGSESESDTRKLSTNSYLSTERSWCADEINSSSDEDELRHTIGAYRKLINRQRKKFRSSLSSTDTNVVCQEPILQYREKVLHKYISLLFKEEEKQQSIINQVSEAIKFCKNSKHMWSRERVESECILSLAVLRLDAILFETKNLKCGENSEKSSFVKGTLDIYEICIKLKEEYVQDSMSKNYDGVTWFMCTVQHKTNVHGTQPVCTVEEGHIKFPDFFTFYELETNFLIKIKVFTLSMKKNDSENKPKWNKLNRFSGRLHPSREIFDSSTISGLPSMSSTPTSSEITGFCLDSYMEVDIYNLPCKPQNFQKISQSSPLSAAISFEHTSSLAVNKTFDGFLTMFGEPGGFGNWERRWFVLSDFTLKYWNYPFEADTKTPIGSINLQYTLTDRIQLASKSECPRPRTMLIDIKNCEHAKGSGISINSDVTRHLLSADTFADIEEWCEVINYLLCCLRDWKLMKS